MHFATLVAVEDLSDIEMAMAPFAEDADEEYLEFYDETDELKEEYERSEITAIRLANGKLISSYELDYHKYEIKDDLVYEKCKDGTYQRTPKVCGMTVLPNTPTKDVYKTYRSYASRHAQREYNKEYKRFGYFCNPNAQWDWWETGGRFSGRFLVKNTCEYAIESSAEVSRKYVPKGYRLVDGARICDIEWDMMNRLRAKRALHNYYDYKRIYMTGKIPEKCDYKIDLENKCLKSWGDILYYSGESLESFLERMKFSKTVRHNVSCCNLVTIDGEWISEDGSFEEWRDYINREIGKYDSNICLVMADCALPVKIDTKKLQKTE